MSHASSGWLPDYLVPVARLTRYIKWTNAWHRCTNIIAVRCVWRCNIGPRSLPVNTSSERGFVLCCWTCCVVVMFVHHCYAFILCIARYPIAGARAWQALFRPSARLSKGILHKIQNSSRKFSVCVQGSSVDSSMILLCLYIYYRVSIRNWYRNFCLL